MDDETCFLCKRNRHAGRLERHHIFGAARRSLSEKYELTVTLCEECHRTGIYAVHRCADTMQYVHQYGQRKAMLEQGWTVAEFASVFGKNYLNEGE